MPQISPTRHPEFCSTTQPELKVRLAAPRGFCAGVRRAIDAVTDAIATFGPPVYVRRAIVHNRSVVSELESKGAVFVEELSHVPSGAVAILSAHGVARRVVEEGAERRLKLIDATCPLVAKIHREVGRHHSRGRHVVLIGHADHPEIVGTLGQLPSGAVTVVGSIEEIEAVQGGRDRPIAYAVQTTYSVDEAEAMIAGLRNRFSDIAEPHGSDICYATSSRQAAVRQLAGEVDAMLIAGESFSSNACRLVETARSAGCGHVQLVADAEAICFDRLKGVRSVGVSAAASTPERTVQALLAALARHFSLSVEEVAAEPEQTTFKRVAVA